MLLFHQLAEKGTVWCILNQKQWGGAGSKQQVNDIDVSYQGCEKEKIHEIIKFTPTLIGSSTLH
jgi:hypothetical protein